MFGVGNVSASQTIDRQMSVPVSNIKHCPCHTDVCLVKITVSKKLLCQTSIYIGVRKMSASDIRKTNVCIRQISVSGKIFFSIRQMFASICGLRASREVLEGVEAIFVDQQ